MPSNPPRAPLVMAPFRGLRFDPAVVGDLGAVVSPPYDVLDAETVRDLERGSRWNIVRLILSRQHARPYLAVKRRLEGWRAEGALAPDPEPALYLYDYTVGGDTVRGVIGLLGLRQEHERVVLPHEEVMAGPVEDRTVLMRTTGTNPEPILLVHEGSARLRALLGRAAEDQPLTEFTTRDGSRHRIWSIVDRSTQRAIAEELAPGRALIADGHHRYAAYLALQQELRDPQAPPDGSPWDFGLAMLVDQNDYPLHVGAVHRSLSGLTMSQVQETSIQRGDTLTSCSDREGARALLASTVAATDHESASFALSDGRSWWVLNTKRRHDVDAAVLHHDLLPAWRVSDDRIGYHHSLEQALHATTHQPGVVVGLRPARLVQVMAAAARGERMPRKTTSFTPKPSMGVVLRDLRDSVVAD